MAQTTVTFNGTINSINQSLQIGDTLYYALLPSSGNFTQIFAPEYSLQTSNSIFKLGTVKSILFNALNNTTSVLAEQESYINPPPNNSFIFFSKDSVVNINSIKGYYGLTNFVNDSNEPAELYAVSCDITESSK